MFAYLLLGPDELEAFTAGSPDNTDDNARIEFSAPRDLLGYAKFEPYRANVYGPMWPYGRLSELVRGYDGPDKSSRCGRLARSLLAHGKAREAELWTRRAEAAGASPERSTRACCSSWCRRGSIAIPRSRWRRARSWTPPAVPGYLAGTHPELVAKVKEQYPEVLAHYNARRYVTGYKVLEAWPEDLWAGLGKDFSLLTGFLDYKAEIYADAIDELKALADDAAYVARRPEVLYYLGRSYYAASQFTKAVDALERYVRSQTVLGRDILPGNM